MVDSSDSTSYRLGVLKLQLNYIGKNRFGGNENRTFFVLAETIIGGNENQVFWRKRLTPSAPRFIKELKCVYKLFYYYMI